DAALRDRSLAVERLMLPPLGDQGADSGLGIEAWNAGTARAAALGERALGAEVDLELAGPMMQFELLIHYDIGGNHQADLAGAEQLAETFIVDAGIVGGDGEILDPARLDRVDQPFGDTAQAEPACANGHSVEQEAVQRSLLTGIDFLHAPL